jgi:hypothetical protein
MITTTLNRIKANSPCESGWKKLLKHLGKTKADDAPLSFATILKSNGLDDALWGCRCLRRARRVPEAIGLRSRQVEQREPEVSVAGCESIKEGKS